MFTRFLLGSQQQRIGILILLAKYSSRSLTHTEMVGRLKAAMGVGTLRTYRDDLEDEGLLTPVLENGSWEYTYRITEKGQRHLQNLTTRQQKYCNWLVGKLEKQSDAQPDLGLGAEVLAEEGMGYVCDYDYCRGQYLVAFDEGSEEWKARDKLDLIS